MLYPLKFKPLYKERIWGGQRLASAMGKKLPEGVKIGESWEISGVEGDVSVVANGCLKSNNLQELIEVYMGDLVGEKIYDKYGLEFPVLIKLIDAEDVLSIQVHPDDKLAEERHHSYGKTEMWYVIAAEPGASLYVGFNRQVTRQEYLDAVAAGTLPSLLNKVEVKAGDAYFIPAGTVHAIGAGCSGYAMYRYAENPTEAWLFLKFMASEEGQNAFCSTGNGVPSNKNLLFDEDAAWRNLTAPELSGLTNFNHDAFVYAWDTAACTLQDFKLLIDVVAAREPVAQEVSEVMTICLSSSNSTYQTDIVNAFARGEASIYSTIEGYRT